MTEIRLSYTLFRSGDIVCAGALVSYDLSAPSRIFESLIERYHADKICVRDSMGQIWEKEVEKGD